MPISTDDKWTIKGIIKELEMNKLILEARAVCHVADNMTTVEMVKNVFGFAIIPHLTMYGMKDEVMVRTTNMLTILRNI